MALWVQVSRIRKEPFMTRSIDETIHFEQILEWVREFEGVEEVDDYPMVKDVIEFLPREDGESKEEHYDRVVAELPHLKQEHVLRRDMVANLSDRERSHLTDGMEEVFFLKRCYDLADRLREEFEEERSRPSIGEGVSFHIDAEGFRRFAAVTGFEHEHDDRYLYRLHIG